MIRQIFSKIASAVLTVGTDIILDCTALHAFFGGREIGTQGHRNIGKRVLRLKVFIKHLNEKYPTIKFTTEWSQTLFNFFDVIVSFIGGKFTADLYLKHLDSHQYLHSSLCQPYHYKKRIPYSQALPLNIICSDPNCLDRNCNGIEEWLIERCYSEREIKKQILRLRGSLRDSLLNRESLHYSYIPDVVHKAVFTKVPIVDFKNDQSLRVYIVWNAFPKVNGKVVCVGVRKFLRGI